MCVCSPDLMDYYPSPLWHTPSTKLYKTLLFEERQLPLVCQKKKRKEAKQRLESVVCRLISNETFPGVLRRAAQINNLEASMLDFWFLQSSRGGTCCTCRCRFMFKDKKNKTTVFIVSPGPRDFDSSGESCQTVPGPAARGKPARPPSNELSDRASGCDGLPQNPIFSFFFLIFVCLFFVKLYLALYLTPLLHICT